MWFGQPGLNVNRFETGNKRNSLRASPYISAVHSCNLNKKPLVTTTFLFMECTSPLASMSGFRDGGKSLIPSKWRRGAIANFSIFCNRSCTTGSPRMFLKGLAESVFSSVCLFARAIKEKHYKTKQNEIHYVVTAKDIHVACRTNIHH